MKSHIKRTLRLAWHKFFIVYEGEGNTTFKITKADLKRLLGPYFYGNITHIDTCFKNGKTTITMHQEYKHG